MKSAYKKRPEDFAPRRIIARIYTSRKDLLIEERRWLQMIKPEEISPNTDQPRYYNLTRTVAKKDWKLAPERRAIWLSRVTIAAKKRWENPEYRKKQQEKKQPPRTKETTEKITSTIMYNCRQRRIELVKDIDPALYEKFNYNKTDIMKETGLTMRQVNFWMEYHNIQPQRYQNKYAVGKKWWNNGVDHLRTESWPGDGWIPGRIFAERNRECRK